MLFHKDTQWVLPTLVEQGYNTLAPAGPRRDTQYSPRGPPAQETCRRLPQIKERTAVTSGQLTIGEEPSVDHQQFICSLRNHIMDQCTVGTREPVKNLVEPVD